MNRYLGILLVFLTLSGLAQNHSPYRIYNSKGKKVSYKKMVRQLSKQQIVFFGELHNNAIAHWLELELTKDLDQQRDLILGAEMFEADDQDHLTSYLTEGDKKRFDSTARFWPNYATDYSPLVEYAREQGIAFVATNIPRRYASMVYRGDFAALDTLSELELSWMAPLPIAYDSSLTSYVNILKMMGGHGSPRLVKAQAMKDATMAYRILKYYEEGHLFLHYNGAYHSDIKEGIVWYIWNAAPTMQIGTISTVTQSDIDHLDEGYIGKADFIIVVDEDMTTTY